MGRNSAAPLAGRYRRIQSSPGLNERLVGGVVVLAEEAESAGVRAVLSAAPGEGGGRRGSCGDAWVRRDGAHALGVEVARLAHGHSLWGEGEPGERERWADARRSGRERRRRATGTSARGSRLVIAFSGDSDHGGRAGEAGHATSRCRSYGRRFGQNLASGRCAESVSDHPAAQGGRRLDLVAGVDEDLEQPDRRLVPDHGLPRRRLGRIAL